MRRAGRCGKHVRLLLGDSDSREVRAAAPRKASDGAAISAKIRNALAFFRTLDGAPGVEVRCHGTTLYSSIYRYDFALLLQQ